MILITSIKLVKLITFGKAQAITLWPFVLVSYQNTSSRVIRHERIHLRQQVELFLVPFYLLYVFEFVAHYLQCRNYDLAYRSISFEREAYQNDHRLDYLTDRRWYSSFRYWNLKVQG